MGTNPQWQLERSLRLETPCPLAPDWAWVLRLSLGPGRPAKPPPLYTPAPFGTRTTLGWRSRQSSWRRRRRGRGSTFLRLLHYFTGLNPLSSSWAVQREVSGLAQLLLARHGCLYRGHELSTKQRETNEGGRQERGPKAAAIPKSWCIDNRTVLSRNGHQHTTSWGLMRLSIAPWSFLQTASRTGYWPHLLCMYLDSKMACNPRCQVAIEGL